MGAPMMTLQILVDQYKALAQAAGVPLALEAFDLSPDETERLFNALDEDYHISRHLHFSKGEGQVYRISGEEVTHVSIDGAIANLL